MELVVAYTRIGDTLDGGCRHRTTKGARGAETHVIGHDQQDVGGALGCGNLGGEIQGGLGFSQANMAFEGFGCDG